MLQMINECGSFDNQTYDLKHPSDALMTAQERLLRLRREQSIGAGGQPAISKQALLASIQIQPQSEPRPDERLHIWHIADDQRPSSQMKGDTFSTSPPTATSKPPIVPSETVSTSKVTLHPNLMHRILEKKLSSPARIWLLLRHIDQQGRGWVSAEIARQKLTEKSAPLHIFGWRRLRQLLKQGAGIFWVRDEQARLWLQSPAKVAAKLGVQHLDHTRIEVALSDLLAGIQQVRATLYATVHSRRREANPISRTVIASLTGVKARTQRHYDRLAAVERTANYVIEGAADGDKSQDVAHQHGAATFYIHERGRAYIARQIGNSYQVNTHRKATRGRTRKYNQQLKQDLVTLEAQGNERQQGLQRVYYRRAKQMSKRKGKGGYLAQAVGVRRRFVLWQAVG